MKIVEVRHGCLSANVCGDTCKMCKSPRANHDPRYEGPRKATDAYVPQGKHICGAIDACDGVNPNTGEVCTFGTTFRSTFHNKEDIQAEVDAIHKTIRDIDPKAYASMTPFDHARTYAQVLHGKTLHSPEAEKNTLADGHRHHDINRTLHDDNPHVFGHK